jgi:hypothetical protein
LQQAAQKFYFVLKPVLLLRKHVRRDQIHGVRYNYPHSVDQGERGGGSHAPNILFTGAVAGRAPAFSETGYLKDFFVRPLPC